MTDGSTSVASPEWISIGRACQLLGVNAATLRQWTSTGKVSVYRTPGGHRRFNTAEIASLSHVAYREPRAGVVAAIMEELRSRYRTTPSVHKGWVADIDSSTREQFHGLGDELLKRLGVYLSNSSVRDRRTALSRAREISVQYGELSCSAGLSTAQAIDAYLRFRRPLLDVLARSLSAHPELGSQLGSIMRDAERFMDEVLAGVTGVTPARVTLGPAR